MTIPTSVSTALKALQSAKCPEDVFADDVAASYRSWAKVTHEDMAPTVKLKKVAHEAFLLLTKLHEQALAKVKAGTYGDKKPFVTATLRTKTAAYSLTTLLDHGDIADLYAGTTDKGVDVWVKVCRSPKNNDLMKTEADLLAALPAELDPKHIVYFPNLLDSFEVAGAGGVKTRVNVFSVIKDAVSLEQVKQAYPAGLDPADSAWMWNRMLEALHLLHKNGWIHGAVTPDRFLIVPETHRGTLWDFCYAVKDKGTLKAISPLWKDFYAPEVFQKKKGLDSGADLLSASHVLEYITDTPPAPIKQILKACRLGRAHRTTSAKETHEDYAKVLRRLYGPKKFRHFAMPTT